MGTFSRHYEAAKLLATAARHVAGSVKAVRSRYHRKECPAGAQALAQELLSLIQGALQLAAAAEHTSRTILARAEGRAKRKVAKGGSKGKAAKGGRAVKRKKWLTATA